MTTELIPYADTEIAVTFDDRHGFLIANAELARVFGIQPRTLTEKRRSYAGELIEGIHYAWSATGGNTPRGGPDRLLWTQRGAVRAMSFGLRSPNAVAARDWLEDLGDRELTRLRDRAEIKPETDLSQLVVAIGALTKASEASARTAEAALELARNANAQAVDAREQLGHVDYRFGKGNAYIKAMAADVARHERLLAARGTAPAEKDHRPAATDGRMTAWWFCHEQRRTDIDRGQLGHFAADLARSRRIPAKQVQAPSGDWVHAWPREVWEAALAMYDHRRVA